MMNSICKIEAKFKVRKGLLKMYQFKFNLLFFVENDIN